jgi:serine protease Do
MSEINRNISDTVFKINTAGGSGSGFYLKNQGIIVTNCHVVFGNKLVAVEDNHKNRFLANVIFINPEADIAFLKPETDFETPVLEMADSSLLKSRDKVLVLGFPFGMPYSETEGIISSPNQLMEGKNYVQTDAAVNPGNSGGPVIDMEGKIIGITTSKFTEADNMGFAIPANILLEELKSLSMNNDMVYSIKCNSCSTLIFEKSEYCENCGNSINPALFDEIPPTHLAKFVEEAIQQLNINPVLTRTGYEFWEFYRGSALLRIFVFNKNYLFATSPLNKLPITNLEKLYRYVLSNPIPPYQLGIFENQVFVSYRLYISDIYSSFAPELMQNLKNLLLKADEMDDFLEKEFGCPKSSYSKNNSKIA